ncbi:hypothetical protein [Desulfobacter postgatei]|uniref:Uncharacterized protein n=1 Tax=Desulfobacter postgatei 2ac9 TaxID=879212 RepID=I5B6L7_9BACT|nr:hypothetical protein [Desulfobacter postgatei]EIM65130.1 hypothetical protein DespoDRAFT_03360 [Desulfobacter postgatei 2ac9]
MTGFKKELITIVILAVMAVTGIYIANAVPVEEEISSIPSINVSD